MTQTKTIATPSLFLFCYELQEAIQEGYEIDTNYPPTQWGILYEVGLTRNKVVEADKLFTPPEGSLHADVPAPRKAGRPTNASKATENA